jgi:hypothetical protein
MVDLSRTIINIIDDFSEANKQFANDVNDVVNTNNDAIRSKDNIVSVATNWENSWPKIHTDFDNLKKSLNEIHLKSIEYFTALKTGNAAIRDPQVKAEDSLKTGQLAQKWQVEYLKATANLDRVEAMLSAGDDYQILLRNNAVRAELSNSITALKGISNQANVLAANIQIFETNAKEIFGGTGS